MDQASVEEVKARINSSLEKLYRKTDNGFFPYVCLICDELLKGKDVTCISSTVLERNMSLLRPTVTNDIGGCLAKCYEYSGDVGDYEDVGDVADLKKMLLSPRACFIKREDGRRTEGFSSCVRCRDSLKNGVMPKFAIANNYCFGTPPPELLDLTDIELAMLTPVKTYGYCFSYTGGVQKQLKGSLSYYKVNISSIARAALHFDVLGLTDNVVVMLYGEMTEWQKARAMEKNKVRTNYLLRALQWLVLNNDEWRRRPDINLDEIRQKLRNPILVDNSRIVESGENANQNVENTESFEVFFPDGTMTETTGGQDGLERFSELVKAASENGFDVAFRCNLMKEAVSDFRDNNLVNACLLQYPYGRGGMQEKRMNSNGSMTCGTDVEEYVNHVSRLSQPHFHHELFSLILYNLSMKQAMVRTAGWRVRNKTDAHALAEEITVEDVSDAIKTKSRNGGNGSHNGYGRGRKVLDAVDAIARSVPHTNEAARKARRRGEAMQHQFGTASYFLTVTPDDDNSFLVQVYAGQVIDDERPIESLSDEELSARAKKRTTLRLKFPGICAFFFQAALEIIIEDVIGWDLKHGRARSDGVKGLFGEPEAFVAAVEEQGRGTLHVHIQLWVKGYNQVREDLHSERRPIQRSAMEYITSSYDHVGSSSLVLAEEDVNGQRIRAKTAFEHECTVKNPNERMNPVVVDDQTLRHLRYKEGVCGAGGYLAYCPHCTMTWTSEELVESYLINGVKVPGLTKFPDNDAKRLKAMAVEYQKSGPEGSLKNCVIDAAYNLHSHTNTSCFGKIGKTKCTNETNTSKKRKASSSNYECRYRQPHRKKQRTIVQNASESKVLWFNWDGSRSERDIKEICIRRHGYDAFQNVCCAAISHSKLTCNTNVSPIMPGPVAQYSFKYNLKETQDQDTEEYGAVQESMQKTLSKPRTHESDRSEAVKRLLAGSFAHLKTNVCRATMARFLTWTKTRFIFSHETVWVPLRDMEMLLEGGAVTASVVHHGRLAFCQCSALHYLCRPIELEGVNAWSFFSEFEA